MGNFLPPTLWVLGIEFWLSSALVEGLAESIGRFQFNPKQKQAYLFCMDTIAEFICDNLSQVKHTHVKCDVTEDFRDIPQEEPVPVDIQVSSLRVDGVLAKVYNMSREKSLELFRAGKVYVDGRLCENNSRLLKAGETVNARGYGKFALTGEPRETRKGKLAVSAAVYR